MKFAEQIEIIKILSSPAFDTRHSFGSPYFGPLNFETNMQISVSRKVFFEFLHIIYEKIAKV